MLYVNYNSINLEKKFIKKRKKPISCIFGTHQKPRETHSSAASSSATQLGKKKACLLTGHIAKDVCFGYSCWGELHPPSPVPGGPGPCLYSLHPQEWFMRKSPRISSFPLIYSHSFTVCLQDHCWMQKVQDLKEMLPFSYWSLLAGTVTALGFRTRAARRALAAWEPLSPRASKCTVHLCLSSSLQFESAAPELLRWQEKSKAVLFDLQWSPGLRGSVSLSAHLISSTKEQ